MWRHSRPPESARRVLLLLSRRSVSVVAVQKRVLVRGVEAEALLLRLSCRRRGRRGVREGGQQFGPPRGRGRRRQALRRAEHLVRVHTRAVDCRAGRGARTHAEAGADARTHRRSTGACSETSKRRIAVDENDASSTVCVYEYTRVLPFLKFSCFLPCIKTNTDYTQ